MTCVHFSHDACLSAETVYDLTFIKMCDIYYSMCHLLLHFLAFKSVNMSHCHSYCTSSLPLMVSVRCILLKIFITHRIIKEFYATKLVCKNAEFDVYYASC